MLVDKRICRIGATDIILLVWSVLYFLGIRFLFPVCKSEMVMSCHWAGESLKAVSLLLLALCLIHLFLPDEKLKMGMDPALAGLGALAAALPGTAISLCASTDMRCHTTELWSRIFGALLILIALADVLLYSLKLTKEKHQKKKEEDEA